MKAIYKGRPGYEDLVPGQEYDIEVRGGDEDLIAVQVLDFKDTDDWIDYCWQVRTLEELLEEWILVEGSDNT